MIINLPTNTTIDTDPGQPKAIFNWTAPTAIDNSGEAVMLVSSHNSSRSSFPIGVTPVAYTATDVYGNSATESFMVTVRGNLFFSRLILVF